MSNSNFLSELKRRNVIRMAGLYLVGAWLLTQVAGTLLPVFEAPTWMMKTLVGLLAIGFVPALLFAWVFEMTPDGIKRDAEVDPAESASPKTAQRMNRMIIAVLVLAIVYFGVDKFVLAPQRETASVLPSMDDARLKAADAAAATPANPSANSIAVLPFVNMSSDKEQEYFSDGLSEELLNQLAQIPQLRVIARTSSFSFKGKEVDVATIAKALGVSNVLEGSVRKSGGTLRITAQLIRAADSSHLWSQIYDREMSDVFKVQDEISREVVAALKVKLLPTQQLPGNTQRTRDPAAYEQYLIGIKFQNSGGQRGAQQSAEAYQRAIALDPDYANAYAGLAFVKGTLADFADNPVQREEVIRQALGAGESAIALAPDLPDGYAARGNTRHRLRWDWQGAQADFQRALELDPSNVTTLVNYAPLLFSIGRTNEALTMLRKATVVDPLSANAWNALGRHLVADHQTAQARTALQRAAAISPDHTWANFLLGNLELSEGKTELAMNHYSHAPDQFRLTGMTMAEYTLGDEAASRQVLATLESQYAIGFAFQIAQAHAWRGDKDQAFSWLDRAYTLHDAGLTRLPYDPALDPLRDDPRFAALVEKMGFPK